MKPQFKEGSEEHLRKVARAADLLREHPEARSDLIIDGPLPDVPSLLLEDFSDIPFLDGVPGIEWYQLRFVLYNVGCLRDYGKFDVIALGKDREEASRRLEEELPERLGL